MKTLFFRDVDGYYRNRGDTAPRHPTWMQVGEILLAARVYE